MNPTSSNGEERCRPVILTFTEFYLPGYKGGGPIRSTTSMVAALKDEFDFCIVTSDRDLGDRSAYPGIRVDAWQDVAGARVLYLSPGPLRWWRIARLLLAGDYDLIYLNSFFARAFSMLPIWLKRLGAARRIPVLLAPRGEFSLGALAIKATRKRCYIALKRHLRLYAGVVWHASTEHEKVDILRTIASKRRILVAEPPLGMQVVVAKDPAFKAAPAKAGASGRPKIPGSLDVVFVSRIGRKKNLDGALKILAGVRGEVHFKIYGPIEDAAYWAECERLINELPANVKVDYCGDLPHARVAGIFRAHHLFLFPTAGESFGHVIAEALQTGCPALISDQTPWRHLRDKGAGWDVPLNRLDLFQQAIQECIGMDKVAFQKISQQASQFGLEKAGGFGAVDENRNMFQLLLKGHLALGPQRASQAQTEVLWSGQPSENPKLDKVKSNHKRHFASQPQVDIQAEPKHDDEHLAN